jgi:hypothetical protein
MVIRTWFLLLLVSEYCGLGVDIRLLLGARSLECFGRPSQDNSQGSVARCPILCASVSIHPY